MPPHRKVNPNHNRGKFVKQLINAKGNPYVCLRKDGSWKKEQFEVCYLVAMNFVPNSSPETHRFVAHKDKNRLNNEATNLYWSEIEPTY